LDPEVVGEEHYNTARAVQQTLQRYKELRDIIAILGVEELSDEDVLSVIRRAVKQRKDSIEQFTSGGRADLVKSETAELELLEKYLPKMMSRDEIKKVASAKMKAMGITDKAKLGQFVGTLMKELKGKADGGDVKAVAEELLK
jgi:uncharacterized protein YqeY